MTVEELIFQLNQMPSDSQVAIWDGFSGRAMGVKCVTIHKTVRTANLLAVPFVPDLNPTLKVYGPTAVLTRDADASISIVSRPVDITPDDM